MSSANPSILARTHVGLMWIAYQPILKVSDRSILGYEAFLRCDDSVLGGPEILLHAAERLGALGNLGATMRDLVVQPFTNPKTERLLFVKLHPRDLLDGNLLDENSQFCAFASNVVLEITERATLLNLEGVRPKITALRALGFRIAVDDLGIGYAGLNSIAILEPDFIKLDATMIRDVHKLAVKQKLITVLTQLSRQMGYSVIADGVETCGERDALIELNCDYLQGYLFARPQRELAEPVWPESRHNTGSPFRVVDPEDELAS